MFIIDGAYLSMGAREIERQTNRKLNLTELTTKYLIEYLQEKTGSPLT